MMPKKIYKIMHEIEARGPGDDQNTANNMPETITNLPVPHRSGPYTAADQHIHARNSTAFITQLLNTTKQNSMRTGRFERAAIRAKQAYGTAASLPRSAYHTYSTKLVFI